MSHLFTYTDMLAHFGVTVAHPGGRGMTEKAVSLLPIAAGTKIAELGCGLGDTARWLSEEKGAIVYGIDAHPLMISKARKRHKDQQEKKKLHFLQSDASRVPFPDHMMDGMLAESVLSFADVHDVLRECRRLLRPGGFFASLDLVADQDFTAPDKKSYGEFYGMKNVLTKKEWIRLLEDYGFTVEHVIEERPGEAGTDESIPELVMSRDIPADCYELMEQHVHLLEKYQSWTGYAYFICKYDRA
ncbi:class I SAM-dependent methyltransferase [Alteribacter natronophilus]|uniref:class I SAM-dependent methyltransferase n=1 Tax=Alteribacter natronophilus TaxID=2583810 RepID=UPI00110E2A2B|nr:class I SAM-dependent methyltransferase [Alteribacter natronophilus]TMW71536.1 class I SAM-dependent methyltransferase [Alteribacter natronophilus]